MGGGGMGAAPGGVAGGGAPMGASAETPLPKIAKRGKQGKAEDQEAPLPQPIKLTKLEQKMYKLLSNMDAPYQLFGQYAVKVPGEQRPFTIDFAYPRIGVGVETDGEIWHKREDFALRDKTRDQKLANVGWRILRFRENSMDEHIDAVGDIIKKNIIEAARDLKKAGESDVLKKYASIAEYLDNSGGEKAINIEELPNNLGQVLLIGTIENENNTS